VGNHEELFFVKDADILLSGDKWTIITNVASEYYATLINSMKLTLGQVRHTIQVYKNPKPKYFDIHWEAIG
jgi:hypothetical protein